MATRIFVYGSLKKNFHNHKLLKNAKFICETSTLDRYSMLNLNYYPAVVQGIEGSSYRISGELYEVDDKTLKNIDLLEGYPDYYNKIPITLGNHQQAFMYVMEDEVLKDFNLDKQRLVILSDNKFVSWGD